MANATQPPEGANVRKVAQCALVLEDEPVGPDSRLYFESFPEKVEESYNLNDYRKIGGNRMPQPAFETYQGGNWGPFTLELSFHAGHGLGGPTARPDLREEEQPQLDDILIEMERKVAWCIAMGMPLERQNAEAERILARATTRGRSGLAAAQTAASKLKRRDPPFVLIVFGSWKIIRARPSNLSWTWLPPFHPLTARPYNAHVRVNFQPIMPEYPTWDSIRNSPGQNGFTVGTTDLTVATQRNQAARERQAAAQRQQDNAGAASQLRVQGRVTPLGG